jgi:hypothetical protein
MPADGWRRQLASRWSATMVRPFDTFSFGDAVLRSSAGEDVLPSEVRRPTGWWRSPAFSHRACIKYHDCSGLFRQMGRSPVDSDRAAQGA